MITIAGEWHFTSETDTIMQTPPKALHIIYIILDIKLDICLSL